MRNIKHVAHSCFSWLDFNVIFGTAFLTASFNSFIAVQFKLFMTSYEIFHGGSGKR